MSVFRIPVPPDYYSRQITGVLLAAPFVLFGLVSVAHVMRRQRRADAAPAGDAQASTFWLEAALIAVGIGSFVVALLYIVASMRYLGDFVPGLMLLATLGFWRGLSARASRGAPAGAFTLFGVLGMAWTAAAGLLLGVTSYHARFEVLNPELFHKLTEWFTF
jgi:hypothetical protein